MTVRILSNTHTLYSHRRAHTHTPTPTHILIQHKGGPDPTAVLLTVAPPTRAAGGDGPDRAGPAAHPYGFGWKDAS